MSNFIGMQKNNSFIEMTDEDLMISLQQGRKKSLDELMLRYKRSLFKFVNIYIKNEDVSCDIVQEAFFRVYKRAETFDPSYKFKTWLYQIALNLCRDFTRKNKLISIFSLDSWFDNEEETDAYDILASEENIEKLSEHREALDILGKEISKLPDKLKSALILFALEEHSQKECSDILGVSIKTVEMRVYRARKILSEKIKR